MEDYESCYQRFRDLCSSELAARQEPGRNEAQVRLDLIDVILAECMGWAREDIFVESSYDGEFSDYELGRPSRQLVIEAKRESIGFELPAGFDRSTCSIEQLERQSADVGKAIRQAMGYGQTRAIPVAAVSNGHQMVVFIASRVDGVPPLKGRALVFTSLEAMEQRFQELWDALSKPGIAARRLHRLLDADQTLPPPPKLSASLADYPGYKNRNPVAAELQILGGMFLEDILNQRETEREFLAECYTPSGTLSKYALVSREILSARYSLFLETEAEATLNPAQTKSGVAKELLSDVFAASITRRPVILLGDVGVGKTMFTRHFIQVEATDILDRSFVFYINFGDRPALASDITGYVRAELRRQLQNEYDQDIYESGFVRSVYRPELQRFANGIYKGLKETAPETYLLKELELLEGLLGDEAEHLKRSLEHFSKAQRRPAVIFLDNVDQRPFGFQEEVFLIAQALAADWQIATFIALRPETFYRSKRQGSLTAYQPRVFTIEPPRVDRVIVKRLTFARRELERSGRLPSFPVNFTVDLPRLEAYLDVVQTAFEESNDLITFVDNMSGGNVRAALGFIVSFVGSGHVDSQKIFDAIDRGGYTLPLHEFFRAVMYGEHEWYYPADSPILNVFDISRPDGAEHFLVPIIVRYVERSAQGGRDQGYVSTGSVYEFGQSLGFDERQVAVALSRCVDRSLLDSLPRYIQEEVKGVDSERVRITTVGAYTVGELISEFQYLDAMSVDTAIISEDWRRKIQAGLAFEVRIERAAAFREYLDEQWAALAEAASPFDWTVVSRVAERKLDAAVAGSRRQAKRGRL